MKLPVKKSYVVALGIFTLFAAYFAFRMGLNAAGARFEARAAPTLDETAPFAVRVEDRQASNWSERLSLRGTTEAVRKVVVRAEIGGVINATPTPEGALVAQGDVLCGIAVEARAARVEQAEATLAQRKLEYDAAKRLFENGNRSETGFLAAKAALEEARATLEQARLALAKTEIRAPFDGLFDSRQAEVGDLAEPGDACGVLVQTSPYRVVGRVSERNVARVAVGQVGDIKLATGEQLEGVVSFVAAEADPQTRTFRVELDVDNQTLLRDGVTADVLIAGQTRPAHLISASALVLNDEGLVGVRLVDKDDRVRFAPVKILQDTSSGAWVSGLPARARLITVGQYYVREGEVVRVAEAAPELKGDDAVN